MNVAYYSERTDMCRANEKSVKRESFAATTAEQQMSGDGAGMGIGPINCSSIVLAS